MTTEQTTAPEARTKHTWPRDHPVFIALTAFFAGLAYASLLPAVYVTATRQFLNHDRLQDIYPLVLLMFVPPLALLFPERTRWFARHFLLGIAVAALVIVGVSALVLWIMMSREG